MTTGLDWLRGELELMLSDPEGFERHRLLDPDRQVKVQRALCELNESRLAVAENRQLRASVAGAMAALTTFDRSAGD